MTQLFTNPTQILWWFKRRFPLIYAPSYIRLHLSTTPIHPNLKSETLTMQLPDRDGDGYLVDPNTWTPEIARAMAEADGIALDDSKWEQILKAREYYEDNNVVPPIRKFATFIGADQKEIFKQWMTGPMKPITKYGGLPKPTGCV